MDDLGTKLGNLLLSYLHPAPDDSSPRGQDHATDDDGDEQSRKSQPTPDDPATKSEVRYRVAETDDERCGTCTHYSKRHSCNIVAGRINPFDVCDWWDQASRRTSGNPYRDDAAEED